MSNQLEFEICLDRVKVLKELIKHNLDKTEKFLRDEEVLIDFDSPKSTMFAELIDRKIVFKRFNDNSYCHISFYDSESQITTTMQVPIEIIKFKEYE